MSCDGIMMALVLLFAAVAVVCLCYALHISILWRTSKAYDEERKREAKR